MTKYEAYLEKIKAQLQKALVHLDHTYHKVIKLSPQAEGMEDEVLETWESFVARFSRVVDMFLMQYIKCVVKIDDPIFNGTLRDYLN